MSVKAGDKSKDGIYLAYVGGYSDNHLEPADGLKPGQRGFMLVAPGDEVTKAAEARYARAEKRAADRKKAARRGGSASTEFSETSDPKDFTADVVTKYLADASAEEKARVHALEGGEGGKGRSTVLDASAPAAE